MGTPAGESFAHQPPLFMKAGGTIEVEIEKFGPVKYSVVPRQEWKSTRD